MTTQTLGQAVEELTTQSGEKAHIIAGSQTKSAHAMTVEALVNGTPLEALCGRRWVPSKDPKRLPVCDMCKELYEAAHGLPADRITS